MSARRAPAEDYAGRPVKPVDAGLAGLSLFETAAGEGHLHPRGEGVNRPETTHEVPVRAHLRTVKGDAPPSGAERRDAALAAHETDDVKRLAMEYVRVQLVALYQERAGDRTWFGEPFVTADDVEHILRAWPHCPPEIHAMTGHWRGSIFRGGSWKLTGKSVRSVRPRMNATVLPCWQYVGGES